MTTSANTLFSHPESDLHEELFVPTIHPPEKTGLVLEFPQKQISTISRAVKKVIEKDERNSGNFEDSEQTGEPLLLPSFPSVDDSKRDILKPYYIPLKMGEKYLAIKDYINAEKYFLEAFSLCKGREIPEEIYTALGFVYAKLGKYTEALEMLSNAIDINPNNPFSFNNVGYVLDKKEQKEYVETCYRMAIKIAPHISIFYLSLGYHYMKEGLFFEAEQYCKKAISLDSHKVKPYFFLAVVYDTFGKREEARDVYRKVAKLYPKDAGTIHMVAKKISLLGNQRESLKYFHQAVDIDPQNAHYLVGLGYAYYTVRNYTKALEIAKKALRFRPDNTHIKRLTTLLETKIKENMKFH